MDLKFPFPTLQDMATLAVAHSFIKSKVDPSSFRRCEKKVKQMKLVPKRMKSRVLEALRGTFDHASNWISRNQCMFGKERPNLIFNVHGSIDERRTVARYLDRSDEDPCYGNDLTSLEYLLRMSCHYFFLAHIHILLERILNLHHKDAAVPQLVGPEIDVADFYGPVPCLRYRFADRKELEISYLGYDCIFSKTEALSTGFDVTLKIIISYGFQLRWDWQIGPPSIERMLVETHINVVLRAIHLINHFHSILQILDVSDPTGTQYYLESRPTCFNLLNCLLVWPHQAFFLRTFELFKFALDEADHFELFVNIVHKQEMEAFEDIVLPFWNAIPSSAKTRFHEFASRDLFRKMNKSLKKLHKNKSALTREKIVQDLQSPDNADLPPFVIESSSDLCCCTIM